MSKIAKDLTVGNLHPRENLFIAGTLASINSEIQVEADGAQSFALDLRDTFVGTVQVQGTIDGTNWHPVIMMPVNVASVSQTLGATAQGSWIGACGPFRKLRAIMIVFTSGSAIVNLVVSTAPLDSTLQRMVSSFVVTGTAASGAALTLSLPSPGVGLRQYLTYLRITRFAAAALTAVATPVLVTTTNIPGALVFTLPAEAAAQGTIYHYQEDFAYPIAASAQNTAMTIVMPITTSVLWRASAGYYVAP